jgi:CheY-like chemotaxis protein
MASGSLQTGSENLQGLVPKKPRLNLLLVDDESTVRGVIAEYLQEDGHYVETAGDGLHALERFRARKWDLVITDRVMPRLDGDGLAKAIKQIDPTAPIILVTAYADRPPDPRGGGSPFDMIIRKPFTHETLRAAIASFAASRR